MAKEKPAGFFPNSKEAHGDSEDMLRWWRILYAAKQNWSIPGKNRQAADWGLSTGNCEAAHIPAQRKIGMMKDLSLTQFRSGRGRPCRPTSLQ